MRLANINEYRRLVFTPDSAPSARTVREQIRKGLIAGGIILAGRYYVDMDEYDRQHNVRSGLDARLATLRTDPRLQGLV